MMKEDLFFRGLKGLVKNPFGGYLVLQVETTRLIDHKDGSYRDLPGGRIDRNEVPATVLQRELEEEAGITDVMVGENLSTFLASIRIPSGDTDYGLLLSVFLCEVADSHVVLSDEHVAYERVDKKVLCERLSYKYPTSFLEQLATLL